MTDERSCIAQVLSVDLDSDMETRVLAVDMMDRHYRLRGAHGIGCVPGKRYEFWFSGDDQRLTRQPERVWCYLPVRKRTESIGLRVERLVLDALDGRDAGSAIYAHTDGRVVWIDVRTSRPRSDS